MCQPPIFFSFLSPHSRKRAVLVLRSLACAEVVRFLSSEICVLPTPTVAEEERLYIWLSFLADTVIIQSRYIESFPAILSDPIEREESRFYHLRWFNRMMLKFEDIFRVCQGVRMRICCFLNGLRCEWI